MPVDPHSAIQASKRQSEVCASRCRPSQRHPHRHAHDVDDDDDDDADRIERVSAVPPAQSADDLGPNAPAAAAAAAPAAAAVLARARLAGGAAPSGPPPRAPSLQPLTDATCLQPPRRHRSRREGLTRPACLAARGHQQQRVMTARGSANADVLVGSAPEQQWPRCRKPPRLP
eukprot:6189384-Pleurochrysis_carterae.AAC.2